MYIGGLQLGLSPAPKILSSRPSLLFRYGHLTWEWDRGIRSYVHPLIFAALYKLLALTGLDTPWFMVLSEIGACLLFLSLARQFSSTEIDLNDACQ